MSELQDMLRVQARLHRKQGAVALADLFGNARKEIEQLREQLAKDNECNENHEEKTADLLIQLAKSNANLATKEDELANANERIEELEKEKNKYFESLCMHAQRIPENEWSHKKDAKALLKKFAIESQAKAINAIKDKWIKKASEMPIGLECRSKGSSCYNWAMFYAKELTDEIEQLRKEQE